MPSPSRPNVYSSTAQEIQTLADLTEEAKLYHEAVQLVLSKPENKDTGPQEKNLVLRHRTLEELLHVLNERREENETFRRKHSSLLWSSSKTIVDTLGRFEKAITNMAQASSRSSFHIITILIESQEPTSLC
jgi:hypothetical protein